MRRGFLFIFLVVLTACLAPAQNDKNRVVPKWEAFGSYTQVFTDYDFFQIFSGQSGVSEDLGSKKGFEAAITGNLNRFIAIEGDFSAHFGKENIQVGAAQPCGTPPCPVFQQDATWKRDLFAFLAGPQLTWRNRTRFHPFFHALFGLAHTTAVLETFGRGLNLSAPTYQTGFEMNYGIGADVRMTRRLSFRYSVDYGLADLGRNPSGAPQRVGVLRSSTGVVFSF